MSYEKLADLASELKSEAKKSDKDTLYYLSYFTPLVASFVRLYIDVELEYGGDAKTAFRKLKEKFKKEKQLAGKLVYKTLLYFENLVKSYKKKKSYSLKIRLSNFRLLGG